MKLPLVTFVAVLMILAALAMAGPPRLSWSDDLPREVATGAPPKNRTARDVDAFFARADRPNIKALVTAFGQPDGFSPEGYYSGGTLRWLLRDGGELHVVTDGAFAALHWASRFDHNGKNKFLSK